MAPPAAPAPRGRLERVRVRRAGRRLALAVGTASMIVMAASLLRSDGTTAPAALPMEPVLAAAAQQVREVEARAMLDVLRADVLAGRDGAVLVRRLDRVRAELERAYEGAEGARLERWEEVRPLLEDIREALRTRDDDAVPRIDRAVARLAERP